MYKERDYDLNGNRIQGKSVRSEVDDIMRAKKNTRGQNLLGPYFAISL